MCKLELIDNKALKLTLRNESADIVLQNIKKSKLISKDKNIIIMHLNFINRGDEQNLLIITRSS